MTEPKTIHAQVTRIPDDEVENPEEVVWTFKVRTKVGETDRIARALRELIPEDQREEFLAELQRAGRAAGLKV